MEFKRSSKYIGRFVITDLTEEAEEYIRNQTVEGKPFSKISNHAVIVDIGRGYDDTVAVRHLSALERLGLVFSGGTDYLYRLWKTEVWFKERLAQYKAIGEQMERVSRSGCEECPEFRVRRVADDEYGFCARCGKELDGELIPAVDGKTGHGCFQNRFVPFTKGCKFTEGMA